MQIAVCCPNTEEADRIGRIIEEAAAQVCKSAEAVPFCSEDALWSAPRLIITPHVAGDTTLPHTLERIVDLFLEDLDNYCAGRPLARLVDRSAGY